MPCQHESELICFYGSRFSLTVVVLLCYSKVGLCRFRRSICIHKCWICCYILTLFFVYYLCNEIIIDIFRYVNIYDDVIAIIGNGWICSNYFTYGICIRCPFYTDIFVDQMLRGTPWVYSLPDLCYMSLFIVLPLLCMPRLKRVATEEKFWGRL